MAVELAGRPGTIGLIRLVDQGKISSTVARRDLFAELCRTGQAPDELLRRELE